ncbi:MAG: glycerol-3-phosphate acyltransferase [Deinococcales bacterium]
MQLDILLTLVLAYVLGALPLGYWYAKLRGLEPLKGSPYNIGFENSMRVLGSEITVASFALDFLKAALVVGLVSPFEGNELAFIAAFAGFVGHQYPPALLFQKYYPIRGRGNVFLLGAMAGMAVFAEMPYWTSVLPVVVFAAVLGWTRYVTLGTLAGVVTLGLIVFLTPSDLGARWAAVGILLAATWRFKENLGRILEKNEPKVGEIHHIAGERDDQVVAAFIIHPLAVEYMFKSDRFGWLRFLYDHKLVSESQLEWLGKQVRPFKIGELRGMYTTDGKEIRCILLTAPLLPRVFKNEPELVLKRAIQGARLARELGASVYGLGAFWGTIGKKGLEVQAAVPEIAVTNGGAYTAGSIRAAIPQILAHWREQGTDLKHLTAAVVGANGVVAFGMARMVAPEVGKVILIGRDLQRLDKSRATLEKAYPNTKFVSSIDPHDCVEADLIFTATSDPNPVVFDKDVKPGAWIYDEGRPADVDLGVLTVPGVRLIPGGVVRPPNGMTATNGWADGKLDFGKGNVPACLAETLIIAANQCYERVSLGETTKTENINYFVSEAERLGFTVLEHIEPAPVQLELARVSLNSMN